jgi:trk system potassium uptake protein TrkA
MKVVVCGAGNIGSSLVHFLSLNYEIIVIDVDPKALDDIGSRYDIQTICGSAADPYILDQADCNGQTHVIGVTKSDEINLVACQLSQMFGNVATTIARLENPAYFQKAFSGGVTHRFQLGMTFSSHDFYGQAILGALEYPLSFDALMMAQGKMLLLGMRIPPLHSWVGQSVGSIQEAHSCLAIARIVHHHSMRIPNPKDVVRAHDAVYMVVDSVHAGLIYSLWNDWQLPLESMVFLGSSPALFSVLPSVVAKGFKISLLSQDEDDLLAVSQKFPSVNLVQGSPVDPALLGKVIDERGCCAVAIGPEDTTNILAAAMAQGYGADHRMACIENLHYMSPLCISGIGQMVHSAPRILTSILQKVTQRPMDMVYPLQGLFTGTILQAMVQPGSKIAGTFCSDWQTNRSCILALYRGKEWIWHPERIAAGDCVMATALPDGYEIFKQAFFAPE